MKLVISMLVAAVAIIPMSAGAQERAGNAAIGAVAGAVVFGPVGALAGAASVTPPDKGSRTIGA
jgi:hypothetical protein